MKYLLACADFTFPLLTHDASLSLVSSMEFDGVDIGLFEGRSHLWPSREFENLSVSASALKAKTEDLGLNVADVFLQTDADFVPYAINHPEAGRRGKARDWFERTLDYAAAVGSPHVTCLPGVYFETESKGESWRRCLDELAWRVEQAGTQKLTFAVEAHVGSIAPNPKAALELVESVPGLTLTLDYTHFTRQGMPDADIEPLVAHASHFHVRGAKANRLQASFKENSIDYLGVLRAMKETGYRGYLGVEYVWIDWEHCNEVDNVSETILYRDFLKANM
ncbi:MAG: sugar phosphate isomerase/epimerase [Planctomycetota bacterium]|nr:sugar phosphate isomerase/epimerase [Planctomycetota bacterium]MDA1140067.1 sugar phosphate isomerase/epimerase [Planctomycetota bacterium]